MFDSLRSGSRGSQISRRQFMATGVASIAGLALSGCSREADKESGGTSVPTQLGWLNGLQFAGLYVADAKGFFSEEGIGSRILGGGPNATTVSQGISGGSATFGVGSLFAEIASAIKAGSRLVVLGAIEQRSLACIISLPAKPITNVDALKRMRIGASNPELARSAFKGIGIADVDIVKVGGDISPLLHGDVDGYIGYMSNQVPTMRAKGLSPVVLPLETIGIPNYGSLIVTARSTLEQNRPLVRGYLRALVKGYELNMSDPAYGAKITLDRYGADQGLDSSTAVESNKSYIESQTSPTTEKNGLFWIDLARVEGPIYQSLAASGLTGLPTPSSYVDLSVLQEVYAGRTSLSGGGDSG